MLMNLSNIDLIHSRQSKHRFFFHYCI